VVLDQTLENIDSAVRQYVEAGPEYGITVVELINDVFLKLGHKERVDLVDEVFRLLPTSAHGELRRVVEVILQPGSTYVPIIIGRSPDPQQWRERMRPACYKLAVLLRAHLDRILQDRGRTDS
jgi:hypothetical protein